VSVLAEWGHIRATDTCEPHQRPQASRSWIVAQREITVPMPRAAVLSRPEPSSSVAEAGIRGGCCGDRDPGSVA